MPTLSFIFEFEFELLLGDAGVTTRAKGFDPFTKRFS
jgi:hypothetical protein